MLMKRQGCVLRSRLIMIGGTKVPCISFRASQERLTRLKQKFHAYAKSHYVAIKG